MTKLDFLYLRILGYKISKIGSEYCLDIGTDRFFIDRNSKVISISTWSITVGIESATNEALNHLNSYIKEQQDKINKIKELLSRPEEEKQKIILEHLDELFELFEPSESIIGV